ncbi:MAG: SRPBCC domain-containing protein [Ignavibacteriaceae bacterium]|nr:SRPBCC domain-containing protein [Ignavibacteriaceae bacterium]
MDFIVDKQNNKVKVTREFAAPLSKVWAAWTQSELLDQWWAPKPWKAKTKEMEFKEGGHWLYVNGWSERRRALVSCGFQINFSE